MAHVNGFYKGGAILEDPKRNKRVLRLKKLIVALLLCGIILPISICVVLFIRVYHLQDELDALTDELVSVAANPEQVIVNKKINLVMDETSDSELESRQTEEFANLGKKAEVEGADGDEASQTTKVYLTFDDGPSSNTAKILDLLQEYDVKATFFVTGKEQEEMLPLYNRIVEEGHVLAMHSYTHKYNEIYASDEAFWQDLEKLQNFLYQTTGTWPRYYRFPGGSSNHVSKTDMKRLTEELMEQEINYLDWNISSGDATGKALSGKQIADNVTKNVLQYETAVVLMHDAADKNSTVEGLRIMLDRFQEMDKVQVLPMSDEMEFVKHL